MMWQDRPAAELQVKGLESKLAFAARIYAGRYTGTFNYLTHQKDNTVVWPTITGLSQKEQDVEQDVAAR